MRLARNFKEKILPENIKIVYRGTKCYVMVNGKVRATFFSKDWKKENKEFKLYEKLETNV